MSLKDALENCLITFDSRVLVSDLLEKYKLPYDEVQETLAAHIAKIEKSDGTKFEKRFIVHGEEMVTSEGQHPHDIFTIVLGESKLSAWLDKLKNAESLLYSVQIAGGAKAPAQVFKPLQHCAIQPKEMKMRSTTLAATNGNAASPTFAPPKAVKEEPTASKPKVESKPDLQKKSPDAVATAKKTSPSDAKAKPAAKKGSINTFFAAASTVKKEEPKQAKNIKPPTPKKMEHFFKKQAEKPAPAAPVVKALKVEETDKNTSVQLFDDDDEAEDNASSSDEEEKLELLRRDIISDEPESMEADDDAQPTTSASKRRRILDSDDEDEQPQQKKQEQEAIDVDADDQEEDAANKSETFMDEDGFVITVKAKKANAPKKKTTPPQKTTAAKKTTPPSAALAKSNAPAAKTKQGNIMSFFTKK